MSTARQFAAGWTILALAVVLVLPACNSVTSSETPEPRVSTQVNWSSATDCPTIEEACATILQAIETNCPGVSSYKNWGDENSCVQRTIGKTLNSYKSCFNGAQMKEIRALVMASRTSPNWGKPGDDPNPEMQ